MKIKEKIKIRILVFLFALAFGVIVADAQKGNPVCDDPASIEGYVLDFFDRPLPNVVMTLDAEFGAVRTTRTNSFGFYRFNGLAPCALHVVRPVNPKFVFEMDRYYFWADSNASHVWYFYVFNF